MKVTSRAETIWNGLNEIMFFLGCAIFIFDVFAICLEVILRYFFNAPLTWVVEITEISLVYITFLPAAWLLRKEGHVNMEMLLALFKPRTQDLVNVITSLLCAALCLLVLSFSITITWDIIQRKVAEATILLLPKWIEIIPVPIGFFLLTIQFSLRSYHYFEKWKTLPPYVAQTGERELTE